MRSALPLLAIATALAVGQPARAEETAGWVDRVRNELDETWRFGTTEYYATFHTTHLPWAYTEDQNKQYQNWPPGFGIGRGHYDAKGNWHGLYAMGFQDSHFKPEWVLGYGWKTYWTVPGDLKLGLGYTAGLTTRTDIGHYTPVPYLLPTVSVDYGKLSIEGAYVPGGNSNGNVMLFWLKWHTDSKSIFGWNP
ncbi:MAG: lipid IV(A) palmitoyltransferase PagP [Rhodocyclaceae bacterium]|nr:lipid IV(A) palmitoyltransferase PagP [Rhodocyclaceae bacterium]